MALRLFPKPYPTDDMEATRLFGDPLIPSRLYESLSDKLGEDVIFFAQIKLEDVSAHDTEGLLPDRGYLYIFIDTTDMSPIVYLTAEEPDMVLDDFNAGVGDFQGLTESYGVDIMECADDDSGIKLFGIPAGWAYEEIPKGLILQYDPLEENMHFLESMDGYMFLFKTEEGYRLELEYS